MTSPRVLVRVTRKMEGSKSRLPTVVPLSRSVIEQLLQQQQRAALNQQQGAVTLTNVGQTEGPKTNTAISVQMHNSISSPPGPPNPPTYTYKVKIVYPDKKSVAVVRYLHNVTCKFESVNGLRVRLMDDFQEHVPNTATFDVGYFEGKQHTKIWLVTSDDLDKLYKLHPNGGEVFLWCQGANEVGATEGHCAKRKREANSAVSKRGQQEAEVESTYKELKERHQESWDTPRLKLWARCIVSGIHDDYDNPPASPAFTSAAPKRARKESLSEAIGGAAVAIVKALQSDPKEKPSEKSKSQSSVAFGPEASHSGPGVSPGRAVDLRMKNYQQLRYLKELYEENILDEKEYVDQKRSILAALRSLD